jgi:uncharacterized protein (TIGR03435 family)
MATERWDFQGESDDPKVTEAQLRGMFQRWLADRFKLQLHHESKNVDGYTLVVAKGGSKLAEDARDVDQGLNHGNGKTTFTRFPISLLMPWLYGALAGAGILQPGTPLVDRTGLAGFYTFDLTLPEPGSGELFTILEKDLGLRLQSGKVAVDIVVIDQAEKPTGL